MIAALGFLSLIQILFLPGALILKLFKLRRGMIQSIIFSFGLSLTFNFLWVMLLTYFGVNLPVAHYALFGVEVILFLWLNREFLLTPSEDIYSRLLSKIDEAFDTFKHLFQYDEEESAFSRLIKSLVTIFFLIWAITSLVWAGKILIANFGTVFKHWDAVVVWNTWAEEWFMNVIPLPFRHAQLIPANFSVSYSFMRSADIQIFAKSIMPLFTIFTGLLILDLALEYKNSGLFIGLVLLRYMTNKFIFEFIGEGTVETALLFFAFLTIYTLLKASRTEGESNKTPYLYLGAVLAAGTALTQQNGMLIFVFYPVLAMLIVADQLESDSFGDLIKPLIKPMILGLAVLLPWYAFNEYRIFVGLNPPGVGFLNGAGQLLRQSLLDRTANAFEVLGIYRYLIPFVLVTLPLISKKFRFIALFTIFPFTIIWIFLLSFSVRNLAMVFPFLAVISGLGIEAVLDFFLRKAEGVKFQNLQTIFYVIPLVLLILGSSFVLSDAKITEIQIADQKVALLPGLNQQLYTYFEENGEYGAIMTSYPLEKLPGFEEFSIYEQFSIYEDFYGTFFAHPEAEYFLVWEDMANVEVLDQLERFEKIGAIEYYFEEDGFIFFKVIDREEILDTSFGN